MIVLQKECKGCGKRMTVENTVTQTHPLQECYERRIRKLVDLIQCCDSYGIGSDTFKTGRCPKCGQWHTFEWVHEWADDWKQIRGDETGGQFTRQARFDSSFNEGIVLTCPKCGFQVFERCEDTTGSTEVPEDD